MDEGVEETCPEHGKSWGRLASDSVICTRCGQEIPEPRASSLSIEAGVPEGKHGPLAVRPWSESRTEARAAVILRLVMNVSGAVTALMMWLLVRCAVDPTTTETVLVASVPVLVCSYLVLIVVGLRDKRRGHEDAEYLHRTEVFGGHRAIFRAVEATGWSRSVLRTLLHVTNVADLFAFGGLVVSAVFFRC